MKIKAGELKIIAEGLSEILKIDLPVKPSYWLARIANKVESEMMAFETIRMNLIKKYAKKDKKGGFIFIQDKDKKQQYDISDIDAFNKEFNELFSQEIEIDVNPIKLDSLGDIKIKPVILAKLGKIIEI